MKIRCLEQKLSMFEEKVILLEKSITELVIKLDTFMCMENSGDDSIDTATDVNEEVIDTEPLKPEEKFPCHLCDFVSNRPYGLVIHKGRKHKNGASSLVIGQFDGNDTTNDAEDIDDELYKETEHYWKSGWLGKSYQVFKDVTKIIDESDLNEEEKQHEKDAIVGARKDALGDGFVNFPPWRRL